MVKDGGLPFVDSETDYLHLLEQSGWEVVENSAITEAYTVTVEKRLEKLEINKEEIESYT